MALELIYNKNTVDVVCTECEQIVATTDEDYLAEWPNSSSKWLEELELRHNSHDCLPEVIEKHTNKVCCEYCGEIVCEYNDEYAYEYPNSCDIWVEQELDAHYASCSAYVEAEYPKIKGLTKKIVFPSGNTKELIFSTWSGNGEIFLDAFWGKGGTKLSSPRGIFQQWNAIVEKLQILIEETSREVGLDHVVAINYMAAEAMAYEIKKKTGVKIDPHKIVCHWEGRLREMLDRLKEIEEREEEIVEET